MEIRLRCGALNLLEDAPENAPRVLLITGDEDPARILEEIRLRTACPFALDALRVADWNRFLSPWPAPGVFKGGEDFAGEAEAALTELTECLRMKMPGPGGEWIAGYSLAGLFALYALYRTDRFRGAVSCSGSLWFPGFTDFACAQPMFRKPDGVYLSLGDREPLTRNPVMRSVGTCTEDIARTLRGRGIACSFAWNPGNHFREPEARLAKGIAWALEHTGQ